MGTYLYEQTSKQFKVTWPDHGVITVNEIRYYCNPYWDLWDGSLPMNEQEKRIAADYRRKQAVAAKRTRNQYVVLDNKDGTYAVFEWQVTPQIIFSDDDNFGSNLKRIGKMLKLDRHWFLVELRPTGG